LDRMYCRSCPGLVDHRLSDAALTQSEFRFSEAHSVDTQAGWFAVSIGVRALIADIVFRAMARNAVREAYSHRSIAVIAACSFRVQ
jgi:hypothetical protein